MFIGLHVSVQLLTNPMSFDALQLISHMCRHNGWSHLAPAAVGGKGAGGAFGGGGVGGVACGGVPVDGACATGGIVGGLVTEPGVLGVTEPGVLGVTEPGVFG